MQDKQGNRKAASHKSNYSYKHSGFSSSSYFPMQQLLERKVKAEAARVQMEYVKKELEYKKMKAELLESEFKVKAEINRRQSEIQATMDVLDAEMNLSVAEAELKIFYHEVENSKIFDTFSNYEEQDPQERTEQYVTEQQPFIASVYPPQESLVPQTLKQQTDSEQIFLKQTIDQQDSQQPTDVRLFKEQQLFHQQYSQQQSSEQQTSDQQPVIVSVQQPSEQIVPKSTTFLPATQLPIEHSSVQEPVRSSVNVQCNTPYGPVYSNEARTYVPSVKMEPPRQQL